MFQPKDTYRILCLGESTTALGGSNSYPYQLERVLNQRLKGVTVKVINKGVPGTDTANILNVLEKNIARYRPDIVITMMGINDRHFTMTYEEFSSRKIAVFIRSLRLAKLVRYFQDSFAERRMNRILAGYAQKKEQYLQVQRRVAEEAYAQREAALRAAMKTDVRTADLQDMNTAYEAYMEPLGLYAETPQDTAQRAALLCRAERIFQEAIAQDPHNDLAYLGLFAVQEQQGRAADAQDMLTKAENGFRQLLAENPGNDTARLTLFDIYLIRNEDARAQQVLDGKGLGYFKVQAGQNSAAVLKKYAEAYFELADYYLDYGKAIQSKRMFRRARNIAKAVLQDHPDDDLYLKIAYGYLDYREHELFLETVHKCLELNPANAQAYHVLEKYHEVLGELDKMEAALLAWVKHHPKDSLVHARLGKHYRLRGKDDLAEERLKAALEINPANELAYDEMIAFLSRRKLKKAPEDQQGFTGHNWGGFKEYHETTKHNYRKLKEILNKKGIPYFCMQYPALSIQPLKDIFEDSEGIIFIDNEALFLEAVAADGYETYFIDRFATIFGHCSVLGDRLLAENAAQVLIKEYFDKRK